MKKSVGEAKTRWKGSEVVGHEYDDEIIGMLVEDGTKRYHWAPKPWAD